jgi:polysaccharide pyruvyl transferase WcaK-like protein
MSKKRINHNIKICLLGPSFDTGNMGVSALTESSIKCILYRWPEAEVTLLGSGRAQSEYQLRLLGREVNVKSLPVRFCKNIFLPNHFAVLLLYAMLARISRWQGLRKKLAAGNQYAKAIIEADMVADITSGDSFSDIYGMRRFILGFLRKWLIKVFQKKLVLLPQTYGPFNKRITKALARDILVYATVVYSRDRNQVDYVRKLLNSEYRDEKVKFLPDVGFILDSHRPESTGIDSLEKFKAQNRILVGLNISGLLNWCSRTKDNMFNLKVDYLALVDSVVELLMKYDRTAVLLVPHVFPPDRLKAVSDAIACRTVYEQMVRKYGDRIFLANSHYSHNEIKYVIGLCDFFIGSRMHACIAALSQGIPAVGLAYSRKFSGVFESVGAEELVFDMRQHTQDEILEATRGAFEKREVIRERLHTIIPDVQAKILNIFSDLEP